MVFSSPFFLFAFLPVVLLGILLVPARAANAFLVAASLLFYVWGEVTWGWVILASIGFNYGAGLALGRWRDRTGDLLLGLAIVANLGLLGWFKYADFVVENLNAALRVAGVAAIRMEKHHLPIGISFFTFHALSYVVDVHRRRSEPQRSLVAFSLYVTFFPQLIAGPIVRYHDIAHQLPAHRMTTTAFASGVRRFVVGLGKKVLVANTVATAVDALFALPQKELTPALAWIAAGLYAIQIYFDFSGYSDMAIGLAGLFGLVFPENFAHPYASRSVTEFWRRWHISLSTWFRDYLYIPLGGNRRGKLRTATNLVVVFFLCGLWHGASWTFVLWGLFHGAFLVLERSGGSRLLARLPRLVGHAYTLLVVTFGWVLFRADSLPAATRIFSAMFGGSTPAAMAHQASHWPARDVVLAAAVGAVGSLPVVPWLAERRARLPESPGERAAIAHALLDTLGLAALVAIFLSSVGLLASGTYDPFIYFRF
ncbi:MAG TPA: MBOAT family protein [Polyangiaceae bacterium]|nr:MBOAT family protein [Polyangiaceae bacterium]